MPWRAGGRGKLSPTMSAPQRPRGRPHRRSVVARAPGRVNLVGDHTDYNAGLALPMAIDLCTEVAFAESDADVIELVSEMGPLPARLPVDLPFDPEVLGRVAPAWARLAGAVVAQAAPRTGGVARVTSTVPVGAGLSSSAAFSVALAVALGVEGSPTFMARFCQRAEAAAGVDVGLMDPMVSVGGREGCALLVDFSTLEMTPVPLPAEVEVVVVHSGEGRTLGDTPYAARRAECEAAAAELGRPLGQADEADLPGFIDPVLRRRARHVVGECRRVVEMAAALRDGDLSAAGRVMVESHASLAGDFEASTPAVDALVEGVTSLPGVFGARMTGGGFGGSVVALARGGAVDPARWPGRAWKVRAVGGVTLREAASPTPSGGS